MTQDLLSQAKALPLRPGVYLFKDNNQRVVYVGKALSLKDRVGSYFSVGAHEKQSRIVGASISLDNIPTRSGFEALLLEANLIQKYQPKYNVSLRDGKSYLYIFISTNETYPIVSTCRKSDFTKSGKYYVFNNLKGEIFGPYTSAAIIRDVLKQLRRVFPYCQQVKFGKRPCFYSHLGLCNPCPSEILKLPTADQSDLKRQYRRNVLAIKRILEGKLNKVEQDLVSQMREFSKQMKYEQAATFRNQIRRLQYVDQGHDVTPYLTNPDFYFQTQQDAVIQLLKILNPYFSQMDKLTRIECFDISNLGTTSPVGSQIVFVDGIPEKKEYKRYHIRTSRAPNDTACMREMLSRRLKHNDWPTPDLIVVDGGKPQLSTALEELKKVKLYIPIIGLAKRLEQIVIAVPQGYKTLRLERNSQALQLLQQLRDEAHRFANTFQRKTRTLPKV